MCYPDWEEKKQGISLKLLMISGWSVKMHLKKQESDMSFGHFDQILRNSQFMMGHFFYSLLCFQTKPTYRYASFHLKWNHSQMVPQICFCVHIQNLSLKKNINSNFLFSASPSWKTPAGRDEDRGAPVEVNIWPLFSGVTGPRLHSDLLGLTNRWSVTCHQRRGLISLSHFWHSENSRSRCHCRHITQAIQGHTHTLMKILVFRCF